MNISPARESSFEILNRVETQKSYSSILLPHFQKKLDQKDAALCQELTLGVLRKKIYLDECVNQLAHKKQRFDVEVLNALRLGLYQLYFLDRIPNYSAINESVNLVKSAGKRSASGLVNAILRRAAKAEPELSFDSETEELSVTSSHPVWLIEKWVRDFGFEKAKLIAEANNRQPQLSFRLTVKAKMAGTEKLESLIDRISSETVVAKSETVKGCFEAGRLTKVMRELAESGYIYFQDPGSQLVAGFINLAPGSRFLDACAAPGGKTSLIFASDYDNEREKIDRPQFIAGDIHQRRAGELKRNCTRQGADSIAVVVYDGEKGFPFANESFHTVLIDAPCSGTGTIRHNPEIRYLLEFADFDQLACKQLAILKNASNLVKANGQIIYSTCSLEKEENEQVIDNFLSTEPNFVRAGITEADDLSTVMGDIRTFPHRDDMDGFYVSVLSRKA